MYYYVLGSFLDNTVKGDAKITREEFIKLLYRIDYCDTIVKTISENINFWDNYFEEINNNDNCDDNSSEQI